MLVVDDDEANRRVLRQTLERRGHRVLEAETGEAALDQVASEKVDTVLLDVVTPGMGGFRTCQTLKGDRQSMAIPVLLVTALEDRADRLRGIRSGADDFINKPLDVHELSLRVGNAVRSKKLYDEVQSSYRHLQRLEELRDSLTHMLVHDLRTPLTGIIGYAHLLKNWPGTAWTSSIRGIWTPCAACPAPWWK